MSHIYRHRFRRDGEVQTSPRWYTEFAYPRSKRQRVSLFEDKKASERALHCIDDLVALRSRGAELPSELVLWAERLPDRIRGKLAGCGLLAALDVETTLEQHVAAWKEHLDARDRTPKYVAQETRRVKRLLLKWCGFRFFSDVDAAHVDRELRSQRTREKAPMSKATSNHYLHSARSFIHWMLAGERASIDPLRSLKPDAPKDVELKRPRRALSQFEKEKLLRATESGPPRWGLSGAERCLLYRLAWSGGLRAGELGRLTVGDFRLQGDAPTVFLQGTKNGTDVVHPLPSSLGRDLARYFDGRGPDEPAWRLLPWQWSKVVKGLLKPDLDAAGVAYRDRWGRYADLHGAGRHTYCTDLAETVGDIGTLTGLTRHRTHAMVMRYVHAREERKRAAVEGLDRVGGQVGQNGERQRTGTDDGERVGQRERP